MRSPTKQPEPLSLGTKKDQGKLRFDLVPSKPLEELVRVYTIGANKYGDRNWEKGIAWGRIFAAMLRHAWAYWRGEKLDPVDGQHHMASVAWCALAFIEYETTHPELDDRKSKTAVDMALARSDSRIVAYDPAPLPPAPSIPRPKWYGHKCTKCRFKWRGAKDDTGSCAYCPKCGSGLTVCMLDPFTDTV